jgi:pimeloyl-ACP methyl ester carboxylesterase
MHPESRYLDLSTGVRAHYLTWTAAGERGPIVLSHATGFLAALWGPVAVRLADAGYTVLAPDARGHGDSDKPEATPENYDWHRFAEDLTAFLDALNLRGIHYVGHSMGAGVGLFVAGHDPGRFSRIVAIEPIVRPAVIPLDPSGPKLMADAARRRRMVFGSAEEAFEQYRSRSLFQRWPDEMLRLYINEGTFKREDGQVRVKCSGEIEGAIFEASGSLPTWEVLPQVNAPVLVLAGEHSDEFTAMVARGVSGQVPDGRLVTVPDAGHLVPMERPDAVADEVLGFLSEL